MSEKIRSDSPGINDILDWYGHNFYCTNCTKTNHRYIRKGILIKEVSTVCDNCGCGVNDRNWSPK